ncbi:CMGC/SRPK protein kinase [Trichophyton tonsurans CBS 112818]|uniref:non-specific serine/threonine protein kinase n=1 Tax=Trichophyton tonsurans (strain CBS 112818) TaxID=647933 RepID=F2RU96_TRIT1|nr:CMGC/SRPK protein kinase [Trichophyton tonsurans CBS 112818]
MFRCLYASHRLCFKHLAWRSGITVHAYPRSQNFTQLRSLASHASAVQKPPITGFTALDERQKIEEERFGNYVAECFYPVHIGEIFQSRYQVITKLGYGATSTVWLCRDLQEHRYLTLKVNVRSKGPNPEIELTNYMKSIEDIHGGEGHVRRVLDSFSIDGTHGTHCCILYEPTGIDLSDFIHRLEGGALPQIMLRPAVRYILIALDYIHQLGIIHTDIQPNNILLGIDDQSVLLQLEQDELERPVSRKQTPSRTIYLTREMPITKGFPILSDMGEARRAETKQRGLIQPSIYRAPEVMLDMEWDNKVDIWGLAQTIWTIFEQRHLFDNINPMGELDHGRRFAEMISLMGPPPLEFLKRSEKSLKYWDENGNWKLSHLYPIPKQSLESREIQLNGDEKKQFLEFMRKMLQWMPEDRADAQHLLFEDPWVRGGDY